MQQPKPKPQSQPTRQVGRVSRASRAITELGNFAQAFGRFVHYKLTHASEERWRTVALCLALSATFWFLRAMARPTSFVIPFQVKLKYDRMKYFLPENPPDGFKASITAQGWNLAGMWTTLRSNPVVYKPELHRGSYKYKPNMLENHLQHRFEGIKVNYVVVPLDTFRVDSMVHRGIVVTFDSGQGHAYQKSIDICFFGPSMQVAAFPTQVNLSKSKANSTVKSVFPPGWQGYICSGQRGQLLSNLLH